MDIQEQRLLPDASQGEEDKMRLSFIAHKGRAGIGKQSQLSEVSEISYPLCCFSISLLSYFFLTPLVSLSVTCSAIPFRQKHPQLHALHSDFKHK